jgi:hypothetical protein
MDMGLRIDEVLLQTLWTIAHMAPGGREGVIALFRGTPFLQARVAHLYLFCPIVRGIFSPRSDSIAPSHWWVIGSAWAVVAEGVPQLRQAAAVPSRNRALIL